MAASFSDHDDLPPGLRPAQPRVFVPHPAMAVTHMVGSFEVRPGWLRRLVCDLAAGFITLAAVIVVGSQVIMTWNSGDDLLTALGKTVLGFLLMGVLGYLFGKPYLAARRRRRQEIRQIQEMYTREAFIGDRPTFL